MKEIHVIYLFVMLCQINSHQQPTDVIEFRSIVRILILLIEQSKRHFT